MTLVSAGRYKTEGNPFGPLSPDARKHMQDRVDGYYGAFTRAVARNRGVALAKVRNGMGQGCLLDAERAKREGMVDDVATIDTVVRRLALRIGPHQLKRRAPVQPSATFIAATNC
jgi:ClpP class serine protease